MKRPTWPIQFVQLELVKCGKEACKKCKAGPSHGPYWYGYNWQAPLDRKCYIGKELPEDLAHLTNDRRHWKAPEPAVPADLPGQLTLDEMVTSSWFALLGIQEDWPREEIRKKVYHYTHSTKHDNNEKTSCAVWFTELCRQRGWKLPR